MFRRTAIVMLACYIAAGSVGAQEIGSATGTGTIERIVPSSGDYGFDAFVVK